jgi:hypothetical protein
MLKYLGANAILGATLLKGNYKLIIYIIVAR